MAAFADDDLLDAEFLGRGHMLDGDTGGLGVIVEDAVVDAVVAAHLAGQGPGEAGGVEDGGEGGDVFRPGHDFAGVVDEQDVGALLVKGGLEAYAGDFAVILVDEFDVVLDDVRSHAGGGAALHLQLGALGVEFLGSEAHFLAEDLADFTGDHAVVDADGADLGAAAAQVAAVGQLAQTDDGLPVQREVTVTPFGERFLLDVLVVDAAQDFRAEIGAVHLVLAAHLIEMAGGGAGVALGAAVHVGFEHVAEKPVVFLVEELAQAGKELVDEFLFLGRSLGTGNVQDRNAVERVEAGVGQILLGIFLEGKFGDIEGQIRNIVEIVFDHLSFDSGDISKFLRFFHHGALYFLSALSWQG